jgi:hypothetical protein
MEKARVFFCDETRVFNKKGFEILQGCWYWVDVETKRVSKPFNTEGEALLDSRSCGYNVITKRNVSVVSGKNVKNLFDIHGNKTQSNKWYYLFASKLSQAYNSRERAEQVAISRGYEVINPINDEKKKMIEVKIIQGKDSNKAHDINCDTVKSESWYYDYVNNHNSQNIRMSSEAFDTRERAVQVAKLRNYKVINPSKENFVKKEELPIVYNFGDFYNTDNTIECTTLWMINS